ncbi:MAG: cell division protein FtsZ [Hyphomonadaceae bacterium]
MAVELKPRIVVIGVGGAGGNAINNMIEANLQGVEFLAANTDAQALARSKAPTQIQLGVGRTSGLGAGANPDIGAEAAKESSEEIKKALQGAHMCFIAAGMGGGTGTGAAPIIARIAKEQNVLTVGVVTKPFDFEGRRRMSTAERGIADLRAEVDTLIVIPNQNLFRIASKSTTLSGAFHLADQVLYAGVRSITDLMVMPGLINLDFADVRTVMAGMGTAMMGAGEAEGDNRALEAAREAVANPLLDDVSLKGAKGVIINITGGHDMTLFEVDAAANEIRKEVDQDGHIILGSTFDESLEGKIRVSVVAAGVTQSPGGSKPVVREPVAAVVETPAPEAEAPAEAEAAPAPAVEARVAPSEASSAAPSVEEARPAGPVIRTRPIPTDDLADDLADEELEDTPEATAEDAVPDTVEEAGSGYIGPADEAEAVDETPAAAAPVADAEEPPPPPHATAEPQSPPASSGGGRGLAGLFGWRPRGAQEEPETVIETPKTEESYEDELEIPAFLRRSANN